MGTGQRFVELICHLITSQLFRLVTGSLRNTDFSDFLKSDWTLVLVISTAKIVRHGLLNMTRLALDSSSLQKIYSAIDMHSTSEARPTRNLLS